MPEDNSYLMSNRSRRELTVSPEDSKPNTRSRSPPNSHEGVSPQHTTPRKLAQEIHDEFLVCKICLDGYKNPKCLACLHTFCEMCIDHHVISEATYKKYSDYRDFTCPLCRKRTQLPIGGVKKLPDNFLVSSLSEMVDRQKPNSLSFCEICALISKRQQEANSKCLECNKLLCQSCADIHRGTKVTRDHSIFDIDIEKDVVCKQHDQEVVRFYCELCQECICVLCTFNEHRGHEVTSFCEASGKYKASIEGLLSDSKAQIVTYDANIQQVRKTKKIIRETEQRIHDKAIDFISEIRKREKMMIEEIHNIYGPQTMELIEKTDEMESHVQNLRSTCSLTEVVLHGRDIELLLLKRNVEEKLAVLNKATNQELPSTICKEIRFLPGQIDLGCVQDLDKPALTKSHLSKSRLAGFCRDEMYETDPCEIETHTIQISASSPPPENGLNQPPSAADSSQMISQGVNTDHVLTVDKGVNTRSRSLHQASSSSLSQPRGDSAAQEEGGEGRRGGSIGPGPPVRQRRRHREHTGRQQPDEATVPHDREVRQVEQEVSEFVILQDVMGQDSSMEEGVKVCGGQNTEDDNTTHAEFILTFD